MCVCVCCALCVYVASMHAVCVCVCVCCALCVYVASMHAVCVCVCVYVCVVPVCVCG